MPFWYHIAVLPNFLLGIFPFLSLGQHSIRQGRQFYKMVDSYLVGNTTSTRHVKDYFDCSFLCLEHEPFACLSFNMARNSDNGYHTCELSSSERYLEPQRIEERLGYDYYGTTTESLFRISPCSSNPCSNGGTCTQGKRSGEFSCQCLPEVTVLPFTDNNCNIDTKKMVRYKSVEGVFHTKTGRYKLNYENAKRLCALQGAQLATYSQLHKAWKAGAETCEFGWLIDVTARFPMQTKRAPCGNRVGIIGSSSPKSKSHTYNAWCFK